VAPTVSTTHLTPGPGPSSDAVGDRGAHMPQTSVASVASDEGQVSATTTQGSGKYLKSIVH
jgi:hypothetical protein